MLGEAATKEIAVNRDAQGFPATRPHLLIPTEYSEEMEKDRPPRFEPLTSYGFEPMLKKCHVKNQSPC
jgi:hypothetical protein